MRLKGVKATLKRGRERKGCNEEDGEEKVPAARVAHLPQQCAITVTRVLALLMKASRQAR